MILQKRCPKCGQSFDIDYFEMCAIEGRGVWTHKCPKCESYLRLPLFHSIAIKLASVLLAVALACEITTDPAWATGLISLVFWFLIGGALRYTSLKWVDLTNSHS